MSEKGKVVILNVFLFEVALLILTMIVRVAEFLFLWMGGFIRVSLRHP